MSDDPRAALDRFVAALESHLHAVSTRGEDDDTVDDAYDILADAFEAYDEALVRVHGESTPFYLADDDDRDDDDDDDDHDDDDHDDEDDDEDDLELEDDLIDGTELEDLDD